MAISIIDKLGEIGRYQIRNYCLSCLPVFITGSIICSAFFLYYIPEHHCAVPLCENTFAANSSQFTIPRAADSSFEQCKYYKMKSPRGTCSPDNFNQNVTESCTEFVFVERPIKSTLVSAFGMVCDRKYLVQLLSAVFFLGVLLGGLFFGQISDRFGRAFIFKFAPTMMLIFLLVAATVNEFSLVIFILFLVAMCASGIYQSAFVLGIELVGGKYRFWLGNFHSITFTFGCLYTTLITYLFPQWNHILLLLNLPIILLLPYPWLMQESIRWLIAQGELERARELLLKASKENGIELDEETIFKELELERAAMKKSEEEESKVTWKVFFQSRILFTRTLLCGYIWITSAIVYYSIGFLAGDIGLDLYVSFSILSFIEIAGMTCIIIIGDRFKRRALLGFLLILCGIGNIVCGMSPKTGVLKVVSVCLGKACVSAAFALVYVYTIEIYPTAVRQTGLAICYAGARFGNIIVPYIIVLKSYFNELPFLVIGVCAFLAGLAVIPLPETKEQPLPETMKDVNEMGLSKDVKLTEIDLKDLPTQKVGKS